MDKTYNNAIDLLTSQGKFYINLGLERISAVLDLLGNPQDKLKCIHVAGTNGKGSVCAIIASILTEAGMKTGLYTSPHIFEYTERIKINGCEISQDDFAKYIFEICEIADKNVIHLTEFEILTAVMFKYFSDNNVEVVVLETGLGGRFDATNVIKSNLCSIITHIDLDHTDRLGNTRSKIAFEKAGIIKPDCPVLTCEGYEEIKDRADECNSLFVMVAPYENTANLSLKGTCQQENLSLALAAVRLLFPKIPQSVIQDGIKYVKHPCRFQVCDNNLIIDASHNPNGAMALRESLDFYYPDKKRCFVFGCLKNKDYKKMMEILFEKRDEIYFYHFNNKNSCTVNELQEVCEFPSKQFTSLEELPDDYLKIVCGSFYMLNEIIPQSLVR
ncbi:TPA: bifunctional folylpolyglutamate synthase/dihydrofolate synthase [Candidatus Gastranaerophilales bacterium HUM_20]|nr:folC bifunctional protein [Clostridium sp. CAG:729]DAB18956.1 MAG TPA: bifunctional folylpolyglutamate synthase/dihydrofolate synthase [Candidatus Gastranaerophilales bacterium HUM_20]